MLILALYTATTAPFRFAFSSAYSSGIVARETIVNIVFMVDIFVRFNTAYVGKDAELVTDRMKIMRRYGRSWLGADILWCFPFELIAFAGGISAVRYTQLPLCHLTVANALCSRSPSPKVRSVCRFIVLSRTLRLYRLSGLWELLGSNGRLAVVRVMKQFVYFLLLIHWMACGWYLVSKAAPVWREPTAYSSWIEAHDLMQASDAVKYTAALYWATTTMCTVGYGDYSANNSLEQIYCTVVMCVGALVYALLFGSITSLVASMNFKENQHLKKLDAVNEFMRELRLPKPLRHTIRGYYEFIWSKQKCSERETIQNELPLVLRAQVAQYKHMHMVSRSPVLSAVDNAFVQVLAMLFSELITTPGELLFDCGDQALHVFFVRSGQVSILNSQ